MKIPFARTLWTTPPRKARHEFKNPLVHNYSVQRVLCFIRSISDGKVYDESD